jgi:hypothetical protein
MINKRNPLPIIRTYGWLLAFIIPPCFYYATMAPSIGLGDTALLIDLMKKGALSSHINTHNLTVFIGYVCMQLFPGESLAFVGNLVSVVVGSVSVILFGGLIYRISGHRFLSVLCMLLFMISRSMWWHSTIVENYAFNACFALLISWCFVNYERDNQRFWIYIAAGITGLSLFNHMQNGIWIPAVLVFIWMQRTTYPKSLLIVYAWATLFFILGCFPQLSVIFYELGTSSNPSNVLFWSIGGDFTGIMFNIQGLNDIRGLFSEILLQFPSPFLIFIFYGIFLGYRRDHPYFKTFIAIATAFILNTGFFMFYHTWDIFAFLLPSFVILTILGSYGVSYIYKLWLRSKWSKGLILGLLMFSIFFPAVLYQYLSSLGETYTLWSRFDNTYTNNTHRVHEYIANPRKDHWNDIDEFAQLLFDQLPPYSILIDDDSRTYYPLALYFQRYYKRRTDIEIVLMNSWGFENWGMNSEQLSHHCKLRYEQGRDIFFIHIIHPYEEVLKLLKTKGLVPQKFPLDGSHWIYKLKAVQKQ